MIRNYRVVMRAPVSEAMGARVRADVPGAYLSKRRGRVLACGDSLPFLQIWFRQQGLSDAFDIEEHPDRTNNLLRSDWIVPVESIPRLRPIWRTRPHPKQVEAVRFWQERQGALIEIPTGRGKTWVGIAAACSYLGKGVRTLIVTPLPAQWLGAFHRITGPDPNNPDDRTPRVKVAAVTGHEGYEAVKHQPPPAIDWRPLISRERLLAELACKPAKTQAKLVGLIQEGAADGRRPIPKMLREWFERVVTPAAPYWIILRKSDRVAIARVDLGARPFLAPSDLDDLAQQRSSEKPTVAQTAARVHAVLVEHRDVAAVAAEVGATPQAVEEEITGWTAAMLARRHAQSDLGLPPDTEVAVISWAILVSHAANVKRWVGRSGTVVFDESQEAKSRYRTKRIRQPDGKDLEVPRYNQSWAASYISENAPRVLLLSATPDHNSIEDLWAQYDLIAPGCLGHFAACGVRYFGGVQGPHGMVYGRITNPTEFRLRSERLHFRTTKAEMGDASPMVRIMLPLGIEDLSASPLTLSDWKEAAAGGASGVMAMKLNALAIQLTPWLVSRVKTCVANGERVVVMVGLVSHAATVHARLAKVLPPTVPVALYTGATPEKERLAIIAAHRAASPAVIVATGDAIGTGTDGLQTTHRAIMAVLPWNHGEMVQREGRFDRFDESGERIVTEVEYPIPVDTVAEDIRDIVLTKAEHAAEAFGNAEVKALASDLALRVSEEKRPGALEALAKKLLAASEAREAAAIERETTIRALVAAAPPAAVDDVAELVGHVEDFHNEVFHDAWLDE